MHTSIRIPESNPNHHLWSNHGTWWCHFTVHRADFMKQRIRRNTGTGWIDESPATVDQIGGHQNSVVVTAQKSRGSKWMHCAQHPHRPVHRHPLIPGRSDLGGRRRTSADKLLLSLLLLAGEGAGSTGEGAWIRKNRDFSRFFKVVPAEGLDPPRFQMA